MAIDDEKCCVLSESRDHAFASCKADMTARNKVMEYGGLCIKNVPDYTPDIIAEIRRRHKLTQRALASVFNISLSTVQKWETGAKKPTGAGRKLLRILETKGLKVLL